MQSFNSILYQNEHVVVIVFNIYRIATNQKLKVDPNSVVWFSVEI